MLQAARRRARRTAPHRLSAPEVADAAILSALAALVASLGSLLPRVGALELLSVVPLAFVARRHRVRAVVAAAVAGAVVAFLVGGSGASLAVAGCALVGGIVGSVQRRGRGTAALLVVGLVVGPIAGALVDAVLVLVTPTRVLLLHTVTATVRGFAALLGQVPVLGSIAALVAGVVLVLAAWWWLTILVGLTLAAPVGLMVTGWFVARVGARVDGEASLEPERRPVARQAAAQGRRPTSQGGAACPVPLALEAVHYRYAGADREALRGADLRLDRPEFVVVTGRNGSGKSTLVRLLAGARPTQGRVDRAGALGLGQRGGTALLLHRPESQILGATVAEDVVWGLPADSAVDVGGLLAELGLAGREDQATSTLSGGELQRLALATALAREPRLLLSDESTAMIDAEGRQRLVGLLAELPERRGMTVVHVTHSTSEEDLADRVVRIADGLVVLDERRDDHPRSRGPVDGVTHGAIEVRPSRAVARRSTCDAEPRRPALAPGAAVMELRGVEHAYDPGTPWEAVTLRGLDLTLHAGEGVLVTGENGGGKSTLAWMLAGLLRPTAGTCLLDGRPMADQVGAVALSFQHARLQVQKSVVRDEILASAGRRPGPDDDAFVREALAQLGLPETLATRSVEQLSGGQLRRVVLAGLLAADPRILVLDEPFAGLDVESRRALAATLAEIRDTRGLCLVLVSHDLDEAAVVADRTIELSGGRLV